MSGARMNRAGASGSGISGSGMSNIEQRDAFHREDMAEGSAQLLYAIKVARGLVTGRQYKTLMPRKDLRWHDRVNQATWGEHSPLTQARTSHALAVIKAENERLDSLRVSRDPCPKCGVRADVGCMHSRV